MAGGGNSGTYPDYSPEFPLQWSMHLARPLPVFPRGGD
jgi:hypothetical protein